MKSIVPEGGPHRSRSNIPPVSLDTQTVDEYAGDWPGITVALIDNIKAGVRLALLLRVTRDDFRVSQDQLILLAVLDGLLMFTFDYLIAGAESESFAVGFIFACVGFLTLLFGCYLVARIQSQPGDTLALAVMLLSISPLLTPALAVVDWVDSPDQEEMTLVAAFLTGAIFGWLIAIIVRAVRVLFDSGAGRAIGLAAVMILTNSTVHFLYADHFGTSDNGEIATLDTDASVVSETEADEYWDINVEDVYYDQSYLIDQAIAAVEPERPGITDLYFIGFGGTATEDVFLKEVRSVRQLFDDRFDTSNRSVVLINNPATVEEVPLASSTNLWWALSDFAQIMNTEEDILFLFLTSHGSSDHYLSAYFPPLQLNDLPAYYLKTLLDGTGIKWRIIVVSACYSGGFLDELKDEHSLIMTAASRDRMSFGCSNEREFTYFGEAYFGEELQTELSFVEAFNKALKSITARETEKGFTPSNPQIHVGAAIAPRLEALEARLRQLNRAQP